MDLKGETASWYAVAAAMGGLYVYGAFAAGPGAFGINALHGVDSVTLAGAIAAASVVAVVGGLFAGRVRLDHPLVAPLAAAISLPVFFTLRTHVLNPDGNGFTPKFEIDVPRVGAHVTHDEMLELFVHSRFWFYTHRSWGWTVVYSYQVLSCVAGAFFVYLVFRLARRLAPGLPLLLVAGVLGGGCMQLFFGDVENYTITAGLVVLYLLASWRYIAGEVALWVPAVALSLAMCFHLEAGWLAPTLAYLSLLSYRRTGGLREVRWSAAFSSGLLLATAVYFQFHGLPLLKFFSSHAGHALQPHRGMFAVSEPAAYWLDQLNLLLLLCPTLLMFVPLVVWRRIETDERGRFVMLAAVCTLIFQVAWKSQIGVYNDWNLYAINGLMLSILIWRSAASAARTPAMRIAAFLVVAIGWLHTYAWITSNHFHAQ